MKTIYIFVFFTIIILILISYKKKEKYKVVGTDILETLTIDYWGEKPDLSETPPKPAITNKFEDTSFKINNILKVGNNLTLTSELGELQNSKNINSGNYNIADADIRYFLPGLTTMVMNIDLSMNNLDINTNSFKMRDFTIGKYQQSVSTTKDITYNPITPQSSTNMVYEGTVNDPQDFNIAIIYPGFGVTFYETNISTTATNCIVKNYGTRPLRIKLGNPITIFATDDSMYNTDPLTYDINGYIVTSKAFEVFFLDVTEWLLFSKIESEFN
jgi:hypothetical protein